MDIASNIKLEQLPPRGSVGYLSAEVAEEGQKIILGNGEEVAWVPPPEQLSIPDWSKIKTIRHYFGQRPHRPYPAWFYHPKEKPKLVKDAAQAHSELGIFYRKATIDEKGRYGLDAVWDWNEGVEWRPQPWPDTQKFDPANPGQGKTYIATPQNPAIAQHALVEMLIPQVAAAVAQALKSSGPAAPANIAPKDWDEFIEFQAWKKAQETVNSEVETALTGAPDEQPDEAVNALNKLSPDQERTMWEEEAVARGVKVDGRWSLDRLKSEVEKAAKS